MRAAAIVAMGDVRATWSPRGLALSTLDLASVERQWEAARASRPSLFDGEILSVLTWGSSRSLTSIECTVVPYSWFFAARADATLSLPVRLLGVSGAVEVDGGFLIGRRSPDVTEYPGTLELASSGAIDRSALGDDGTVSWRAAFADELREEVGVHGGEIRCLGLVHDRDHDVFDIACVVEGAEWAGGGSDEYASVEVVGLDDLVARADQLVPSSAAIVELLVVDRSASGCC